MNPTINYITATQVNHPLVQAMIEDHLAYYKSRAEVLRIDPKDAYLFANNLYGLLHHKGIDQYLWWSIMRLNNMDTPTQYPEDCFVLYLPKVEDIRETIGLAKHLNDYTAI